MMAESRVLPVVTDGESSEDAVVNSTLTGKQPRYQAVFPMIALLTDAFWIVMAFLGAYWFRFSVGLIPITKGLPPLGSYVPALVGALIIWLLLLARSGLYHMAQTRCLSDQLAEVLKAGALSFLLFLAAAFFFKDQPYSRLVIAATWILTLVFLGINRTVILRPVSRWLTAEGIGASRVAVVGSGPHTGKILYNLTHRPPPGIELVGTIGAQSNVEEGKQVRDLGGEQKLSEIVERHKIDRLIVTLPFSEHKQILNVVRECARSHVTYDLVPDMFGMMTSHFHVTDLGGVPLLVFRSRPIDGWGAVAKRIADIMVSATGIVFFGPLFAIIAAAIWRDSGRPIMYGQKRIGLDNRVFTMYKFRSMRVDAEDRSGPVWAVPDDPRRTRIGSFLRKLNLDELPQLWNVLRGDMSIVGPRPERPHFVEKFCEEVPRYLERHKVKAGMTGWAQVNGLRGNTSIRERTRYDIYYVENWSLWFDLKILFRTAKMWAKSSNAY
jgi:exopolysaccharide biosynthesis polyprenyl glycosylphosphotransferase